jgi:predicted P-loop ATPase
MAYAHFPVERPRHFIIVGTTNSTAYLTDPTGARRFWPLAVKRFNVKWILEHRDQLWAEACVREGAGESIRLSEELWPEATEHQEARREIDPWEGVLRNALLLVEMTSDGRRRVTTESLWDALGIATDKRTDIMQRLGFKRTRVRPKGGEVQGGFVQWDVDKLALVDDGELSLEREVGADDVPF